MLKAEEKMRRVQVLRAVPGWFWRLLTALVLGVTAFCIVVPWATAQRGDASIGGEYLVVLVAFILPFCIFRSR